MKINRDCDLHFNYKSLEVNLYEKKFQRRNSDEKKYKEEL